MRYRLLGPLALTLLALPGLASAQTDSRPGVAVFPFANGGSYGVNKEDVQALSIGLQEMMLSELSLNTNLRIVDRGSLRSVLDEQNLGSSGRVDPATAARIGKIVGARYSVVGGFIDNNKDFWMNARIIDTETTEIVKLEQVRDNRDKLYELIVELAGKLTNGVNLPPLPAEVREAREKREIPPEAITMYSRAQVYQDGGRKAQAIDLYRQITEKFPAMTEAKEALRQLEGS